MSITLYSGTIIAECRINAVNGRRVLGGYELHISAQLDVAAAADPENLHVFSSWQAVVMVGAVGQQLQVLGTARPQSPTAFQQYNFPNSHHINFVLPLSSTQLAAIEALRQGGDLALQLDLAGLAHVQSQRSDPTRVAPQFVSDSLRYTARLTEWLQILEQMDFAEHLVFTLDLPRSPREQHFRSAHALLVRARDQLLRGQYDVVVSLARQIMESLTLAAREKEDVRAAVEKFKTAKAEMTKAQRALLIHEAVRHYTHLAHHVGGEGGTPEHYSRGDALFTLALASASYSEAVARDGSSRLPTESE